MENLGLCVQQEGQGLEDFLKDSVWQCIKQGKSHAKGENGPVFTYLAEIFEMI